MPRGEAPPLPAPLVGEVFDAHCHLDVMGVPVDEAMAAAASVGVTRVITVGDTVASSAWCVQAANAHPGVWAAVAVHPTEVEGLRDADYDRLTRLAADPRVVAVGETGLDNHWDRTSPMLQEEHFRRHLRLAKEVGKPVMIHDREAHGAVLRILASEGAPPAGVVFHAFSGDAELARECAQRGYYMSFPGVLTFRNAPVLRAAAAVAPPDLVLVETDAPFLTPHPWRGRPNAPYLVPLTLRELATAQGVDEQRMCEIVAENGRRIFQW